MIVKLAYKAIAKCIFQFLTNTQATQIVSVRKACWIKCSQDTQTTLSNKLLSILTQFLLEPTSISTSGIIM